MRDIRSLAVCCALLVTAPLMPQDDIQKGKTVIQIRVVCDDNYPPYVFRDETGTIQGIIPDQWQAWSSVTGIKVVFDAMDWAKAQEEMRAGKADVIDSIFRTPEREQIYDFLAPYADIPVSVYFHNSMSGLAKVQDLKGFRVARRIGDRHGLRAPLGGDGLQPLGPHDRAQPVVGRHVAAVSENGRITHPILPRGPDAVNAPLFAEAGAQDFLRFEGVLADKVAGVAQLGRPVVNAEIAPFLRFPLDDHAVEASLLHDTEGPAVVDLPLVQRPADQIG
mgnify:CR=1 FL=1